MDLGLVAFGIAAMLSIGPPFLVLGLTLLVLGPFRRTRLVFWPALLAIVGGLVAYVALVPMVCTLTSQLGESGETVCRNLIGQRFVGGKGFVPSSDFARNAALAVAAAAGVSTAVIVRARRSPPPA